MKKFFAIISVIIILLCISSCGGKSVYAREREAKEKAIYLRGYEAGIDDVYSDAYDDGYFYGYEDGYKEGSEDGWIDNPEEPGRYFARRAEDYARENAGWNPEEARMVIEAYQNKEPFYSDGSLPSKQDYLDAINSLIYFYDYFYCARYE